MKTGFTKDGVEHGWVTWSMEGQCRCRFLGWPHNQPIIKPLRVTRGVFHICWQKRSWYKPAPTHIGSPLLKLPTPGLEELKCLQVSQTRAPFHSISYFFMQSTVLFEGTAIEYTFCEHIKTVSRTELHNAFPVNQLNPDVFQPITGQRKAKTGDRGRHCELALAMHSHKFGGRSTEGKHLEMLEERNTNQTWHLTGTSNVNMDSLLGEKNIIIPYQQNLIHFLFL